MKKNLFFAISLIMMAFAVVSCGNRQSANQEMISCCLKRFTDTVSHAGILLVESPVIEEDGFTMTAYAGGKKVTRFVSWPEAQLDYARENTRLTPCVIGILTDSGYVYVRNKTLNYVGNKTLNIAFSTEQL